MIINTTKPCIRLYAFSSRKGHTTAEVFIQQDGYGDVHYFNSNDGSHVHTSIRISLPEVKEFQAIARYQAKESK